MSTSTSSPPPGGAEAKPRLPRLPVSPTHFGLNLIALAVVLAMVFLMRAKILHPKDPVLVLCAGAALPVVLVDVLVLKVHRRASTGLDWDGAFAPDFARIATKLLGLVVTVAPFALFYWATPEYQGSFYDPLWSRLRALWPVLVVAAVFYVTLIDTLMKEPRDAYWTLGRLALGRFEEVAGKGPLLANHFRGWLVKGYFFPLMFVWLCGGTRNVMGYDFAGAAWTNLRVYAFLYDFIFFFDLLFATVGYVVSFRALDTHIRSAESTMLGWTVALFCYEPFFRGLFEKAYIQYGGNSFESWLADYPYLRQAWGAAVIFLVLVYVLSTITFGVRFSNLTHRGILTNGPYRFTKHPAYVSKNLSWWLTAVPFLVMDGNVGAAIKRCLGLLMMNFIYFMRARTEERHLSHDPTYVQYALWMNEHGVLRVLNRVPVLRYRAPD
jgi:hypothetical protein